MDPVAATETPETDSIDVHAADMAADGGMTSRKFLMSLLAMLLIVGIGVIAGYVAGIAAVLPTIVGGILGALGIFAGANVTTKWAAASIAKEKAKAAAPPVAPTK